MKKARTLYGLLSLSTLVLGMAIYLLFRDFNNMILFSWIPKPQFLDMVLIPLKPSILSDILRYNIPDMLWFVSGILFFRFIWFYKIKVQKVYVSCFCGMGIILEISQLSKNVPGTFDWLDLLFLSIGAFVEGLLYKNTLVGIKNNSRADFKRKGIV